MKTLPVLFCLCPRHTHFHLAASLTTSQLSPTLHPPTHIPTVTYPPPTHSHPNCHLPSTPPTHPLCPYPPPTHPLTFPLSPTLHPPTHIPAITYPPLLVPLLHTSPSSLITSIFKPCLCPPTSPLSPPLIPSPSSPQVPGETGSHS